MLYTVTSDQITATRVALIDAVTSRMAAEKTIPQRSIDSKIDYLVTFRKRCERTDAFALGFFAHNPVAFDQVFMSHKRSNAMCNIYALPKVLEVARCLNGGAFNAQMGGDNMTLAATILALQAGVTLEPRIADFLNKFAHDSGRHSYNSGSTQASSSLRALEALGIVKQGGKLGNCQHWEVSNADLFARLLDAANGIPASAEAAVADAEALQESGGSVTSGERAKSRSKGRSKRATQAASNDGVHIPADMPEATSEAQMAF